MFHNTAMLKGPGAGMFRKTAPLKYWGYRDAYRNHAQLQGFPILWHYRFSRMYPYFNRPPSITMPPWRTEYFKKSHLRKIYNPGRLPWHIAVPWFQFTEYRYISLHGQMSWWRHWGKSLLTNTFVVCLSLFTSAFSCSGVHQKYGDFGFEEDPVLNLYTGSKNMLSPTNQCAWTQYDTPMSGTPHGWWWV
eukprot:TRINITY_DN67860_c13_g1_i1.p1 TRINITY_DN67860_c13_g1~~TRINITY_DN67860_c13_g1_i1.p1  ORF type:complete len:190 (-),score=2.09 TRINITY_DN67860_c13_g1_i1:219-788(-)